MDDWDGQVRVFILYRTLRLFTLFLFSFLSLSHPKPFKCQIKARSMEAENLVRRMNISQNVDS